MVPTLTPTPDPEPHPAIPAPTPPLTRNSGVTPNIIALHDACTHTAGTLTYTARTPHAHTARTHRVPGRCNSPNIIAFHDAFYAEGAVHAIVSIARCTP